MNPADPRHGTPNGYNNLGCRCDACRAAEARHRAIRTAKITPDDLRHGTYGFYTNYACRCDACRAANAAIRRAQRARV